MPQTPPPLRSGLQHYVISCWLHTRGVARRRGWRQKEKTHVDVPDAAANVVRTRSRTQLGRVTADNEVPLVGLEVPDALGEEAGGDEVEEAGREDEEVLNGGDVGALVDDEADDGADEQAGEDRQGDGGDGQADADAGDEEDALEALAQDGDEGQDEEGVLFREEAEAVHEGAVAPAVLVCAAEGLAQLGVPLVLQLGDAQQDGAHEGDDEGGAEREETLPDVLGAAHLVGGEAVNATDENSAEENADEDADGGAEPDLAHHGRVEDGIALGVEGALDEGEQNRDDDGRFERLAKGDEED